MPKGIFIPKNLNRFEVPRVWPVSNSPEPPQTGSATPMPEPGLSSTPAWDPSSRTPPYIPDHRDSSPRHSPVPDPPSQDMTQHPLLDLRLLNARPRVNVLGGKFKGEELTVQVESSNGRPVIQRSIYRTIETLDPGWVTPKHPNATRDNGLLVVIRGDHCGKYVRRIHHRYENNKAIIILAVVNRSVGIVDTFTGERLELDSSHLCVCEESPGDKKLNKNLMDILREEARKVWAK
jgi:hypothetical protein